MSALTTTNFVGIYAWRRRINMPMLIALISILFAALFTLVIYGADHNPYEGPQFGDTVYVSY